MTVELIKDRTSIMQTQKSVDGNYAYRNISFSVYSLKLSYVGYRTEIVENIVIDKDKNVFDFTFQKPCVENGKICPKGHKEHIILIAYGLPNKKLMNKA